MIALVTVMLTSPRPRAELQSCNWTLCREWTVVDSLANRHAHLNHEKWAMAHPDQGNALLSDSLAQSIFRHAWLTSRTMQMIALRTQMKVLLLAALLPGVQRTNARD